MPRHQLNAFASQPGKAALFRETNTEHRNVDEKLPEGGFLPVRTNKKRRGTCCHTSALRRMAACRFERCVRAR